MSLPTEALSQPISEEMPSGENLEYDPRYMELVELYEAKAKAGAAISGDEQADGGPDWKGVDRLAWGLLENTRDLRVLVYAAIASIHTRGLPEFRNSLALLKVYLQDFWDSVHPQLDPDDNNDPLLRLNTLDIFNDRSRVAMALERVKLVELKGVGQFGVHEADLAAGRETPEEGEEVSDANLIRQAFATTDPVNLAELRSAVDDSVALLAEIDEVWKEKTGEGVGPGFPIAKEGLNRVSAMLNEFSPQGSGGGSMEVESTGGEQAGAQAPQTSGAINSRADVIRVLEIICEYYSVHEPSSPIPLLLRRAQRLVEKSFMEILQDMVPDGVQQARLVSGNTDENT